MEFRWDGPAQVKALGDDPSKAQINALFAIPGDSKSDSSLPHHDVSNGKVGAADKDGCIAAIGALNGSRGGVSASAAEKNKAYSHLASHLRAMGETPPAKQFSRPVSAERRAWCDSLRGVPERIDMALCGGNVEMRAKANGTGGTRFQFDGYASVFDHPFEMWDGWGDQYSEVINQGAFSRTLANNCDVPFLIGHDSGGFSLARTKSGTMTLGQDTHGLYVHCPDLDGSLEMVRQLASAVERGDMDEMSCAFVAENQAWSPDYEQRNLIEMNLHKGDVSVVVFGANDGTAGNTMAALPYEMLTLRRPAVLRNKPWAGQELLTRFQRLQEHRDGGGYPDDSTPDYDPQVNGLPAVKCPYTTSNGCGEMNPGGNRFCGKCGGSLYSEDGTIIIDDAGVPEAVEGDAAMALAAQRELELAARRRQLELLKLAG
jgi:HK97 family phage prohead protease